MAGTRLNNIILLMNLIILNEPRVMICSGNMALLD